MITPDSPEAYSWQQLKPEDIVVLPSAETAVTARCRWSVAGLPACRAGTRGTRYWCAVCAPFLDPRPLVTPPESRSN